MATLEYNAATCEPFLRLPAPFTSIIITPPRMSDVEPSVAILNDPSVAAWMGMPAYPASEAEKWLTRIKGESDAVVKEVQSTTPSAGGPFSGCPVRHIREVREDGTDVFIGDVGLVRSGWTEVLDADEKARLIAENNARAAGDPNIVWHVGYYLAPSHQGRGLMTAAVGTVITQWGIPWMRTKRIRSSAFEGNEGSVKVLQRNGFVVRDTLVEHVEVGEEKKRTLYLLERVEI